MDIYNVKTFNNLVDAVKHAISNPGQLVFCDSEEAALYSIKMHYKTEAYQLYVKKYFYPVSYVEYNFEPAGVYVSSLNAIISPCFLFSYENKDDFEKEFCLIPSFNSLISEVNDKVKTKLIELFIENENGTKALKKIAGQAVIDDVIKSLPETLQIHFEKYRKLVHPDKNIVLSEIKNDLQFAIERTEFSFDELIDIAKCEDKIAERCKSLLSNKDAQNSLIRSILLEKKLLTCVSEIRNNPQHKYNAYLKLAEAIEGKKSVVVSVQSKTGEMVDFTFPVRAFYFDGSYLDAYYLTEKERRRFEECVSGRYSRYYLTQPLIVKYRGKVIYTNVK